MTVWILLSTLALLVLFIVAMGIGRYLRLRSAFVEVAEALCDPGTWGVTFLLRTFVVKGSVRGHPIRFSATGDVRGSMAAHAYLLLEHPVKGNFRFYRGSDPSLIDPGIRDHIEAMQRAPDFYALIVTSKKTPLLAKLLARPVGLGYRPGLLICTFGSSGFNPGALQANAAVLIDLAQRGV